MPRHSQVLLASKAGPCMRQWWHNSGTPGLLFGAGLQLPSCTYANCIKARHRWLQAALCSCVRPLDGQHLLHGLCCLHTASCTLNYAPFAPAKAATPLLQPVPSPPEYVACMPVHCITSRSDSGNSYVAGDLGPACVDLRYDSLAWLWFFSSAILIQASVMLLETLAEPVWTLGMMPWHGCEFYYQPF